MPKLAKLTTEQREKLRQGLLNKIEYIPSQSATEEELRILVHYKEPGLSAYIIKSYSYAYHYPASEKVQTCIIKYASLKTIEDLFKLYHCLNIVEPALESAKARDETLFTYLYELLKVKYDDFVISPAYKSLKVSPSLVIKEILDRPSIPVRLLTDFVETYPEAIQIDRNDNTLLLHWAITTKNIKKVQALMETIYHASFKTIPGFVFDIEQKNAQEKTVLDLALELGNNELTAVILLYGNPLINTTQQGQLITAKIDIPAIHQKRETMVHEIIKNQNRTIEVQHNALMDTIVEVMEIKQVNAQVIRQLEIQGQQIQMQQQMLHHFAQLLGFDMDPMSNSAPMLLQVAPDIRFFGPQEDNNKVHEQTKAYAFEQK